MLYITKDGKGYTVRCKQGCTTVLVNAGKPTPNYRELTMAMQEPNGLLSQHVTAVCPACLEKLSSASAEQLAAVYAQDVEQWIAGARWAGIPMLKAITMAERMAARTPLASA